MHLFVCQCNCLNDDDWVNASEDNYHNCDFNGDCEDDAVDDYDPNGDADADADGDADGDGDADADDNADVVDEQTEHFWWAAGGRFALWEI